MLIIMHQVITRYSLYVCECITNYEDENNVTKSFLLHTDVLMLFLFESNAETYGSSSLL